MSSCVICKKSFIDNITDKHHITPKSLGGTDDIFNLVELCKICHAKIWVENCKGIHGAKGKEFIIVDKWYYSTGGRLLHYFNEHGEFYI